MHSTRGMGFGALLHGVHVFQFSVVLKCLIAFIMPNMEFIHICTYTYVYNYTCLLHWLDIINLNNINKHNMCQYMCECVYVCACIYKECRFLFCCQHLENLPLNSELKLL